LAAVSYTRIIPVHGTGLRLTGGFGRAQQPPRWHDAAVLHFNRASRVRRTGTGMGRWRVALGCSALLGVVVLAWVGAGGSVSVASGGPGAVVRVGPMRLLSVQTPQASDPFMAMSTSGEYLLTWPRLQQWGPFFRVEGQASSALRVTGAASRYSGRGSFDPLLASVGAGGERAVMYGVRRQRGARNVFLGVALTEAAPGSQRWITRQFERPPANVDAPGGVVLGAHGRLVADWSLSERRGDRLVLAQQSRFGAAVRPRTVFTDPKHLAISPLPPAFDSSGGVIAPFEAGSLACGAIPAARGSKAPPKCVPVPERSMVFTASRTGRSRVQRLAANCSEAQFAAGAGATAAILLLCGVPGNGSQLRVSERQPDGSFSTPVAVFSASKAANIASPAMTIAADGSVWVAWDYEAPQRRGSRFFRVRTDIASAVYGASFDKPEWATPYTKDFADETSQPTLLSGASGAMYLLSQNRNFALLAQTVEQPGALGPAITISPDNVQPVVADADANGFAIVMWSRAMVNHTKTGGINVRNEIEARELELP
jgi:hypothetical protein